MTYKLLLYKREKTSSCVVLRSKPKITLGHMVSVLKLKVAKELRGSRLDSKSGVLVDNHSGKVLQRAGAADSGWAACRQADCEPWVSGPQTGGLGAAGGQTDSGCRRQTEDAGG